MQVQVGSQVKVGREVGTVKDIEEGVIWVYLNGWTQAKDLSEVKAV